MAGEGASAYEALQRPENISDLTFEPGTRGSRIAGERLLLPKMRLEKTALEGSGKGQVGSSGSWSRILPCSLQGVDAAPK